MDFFTMENLIPTLIWCGSCLYAIQVRKELAVKAGVDPTNHDESLKTARAEAISAFFYHLMRCFGGGMMANLALGLSPLQALLIPSHFLCATLAWMTVFFCPGDYTYRFYMSNPFVYSYLEITNEIWRALKIYTGIQIAAETNLVTNDTLRIFYYATIGTIRGNGAEIFHLVKNNVVGEHHISIPSGIKISFSVAVLLSVPFVLNTSYDVIIFYGAIAIFMSNQILTVMTGEAYSAIANYLLAGVSVSAIVIAVLQSLKILSSLAVTAKQ